MKASIIIPIFNAEYCLPTLFDCLAKNSFADEDEIILVDNGSTDHSGNICKKMVDSNPELYKYLYYGEKAGSYCARNVATDLAKGDILIFTDSDCKPDRDWISRIKDEIKQGTIIAGGIKIEIEHGGLWENFDSIAHLNSEKSAKKSSVATANMAVFKKDFQSIGKFEERFSGGDYEWSQRAVKKGMKIYYVQEAFVLHPARKTFEEILKKERRISYGDGNHFRLNKESKWKMAAIYLLRILKIDTNFRYTRELFQLNQSLKDLLVFNCKFMQIRVNKLQYAIKGYNQESARELGLK